MKIFSKIIDVLFIVLTAFLGIMFLFWVQPSRIPTGIDFILFAAYFGLMIFLPNKKVHHAGITLHLKFEDGRTESLISKTGAAVRAYIPLDGLKSIYIDNFVEGNNE